MYFPDFQTFCSLASQGNIVPVYRQLLSDTLTPVSAFAAVVGDPPSPVADGDSAGGNTGSESPRTRHAFLLESVIGGEKIARHSFLAADPELVFSARGNRITITHADGRTQTEPRADPMAGLEELLRPYRAVHIPGLPLPRFTGGAVGYAAYDTVRYIERLPAAPPDDRGLPDMLFGLYRDMVIFDHVKKTILALHNAHIPREADPIALRTSYERARRSVDALVARLCAPVRGGIADIDFSGDRLPEFRGNFTRAGFESAVARAQEYIRAGDIFQVVLSQRLDVPTRASALDIYRALRVVNPSPFMFYIKGPEVELVGSSPEILCRVEDGVITNRPLAGTRRRGATDEEDRRLAEELLADPKDRAEHIMLVDLGRNDVGRVAEFGSVRLDDVMSVERYSHVMHICSNVSGRLRPGLTAFDALRAALPVGTVSGAPKVRAMQIIDELEPTRRGPYAGAVGYVDFSGNMDTCIALRTLVIRGGIAYVQVGAGIVADSVPSAEYDETVNKARALLKAIELAEGVARVPLR